MKCATCEEVTLIFKEPARPVTCGVSARFSADETSVGVSFRKKMCVCVCTLLIISSVEVNT